MLVSTVGPTLRGPEDLLDWLDRREPLLHGEVLGILLVDGDDWETLSVFDDVLG